MDTNIYVCWTLDCEATQRAISDAELGCRSLRGFVDTVAAAGMRVTLFVLPGDACAYPRLLRQLDDEGVEVGLHYHPQEEGSLDFCRAFSADEQRAMYAAAIRRFADAVGFEPRTFRVGYFSANDSTFPVTAELGFASCSHSLPGRNIVRWRSNWS